MEDGVIFYLLDVEDDWNKWTNQLQNSLAVSSLQEWICSDNFKDGATYEEISQEITIGQKYISFLEKDQWWKDPEYEKTRDLLFSVFDTWKAKNWFVEETRVNGRPRRAEYSAEVISKALKYSNLPYWVSDSDNDPYDKMIKWSRSILGESSPQKWVKLIMVRETLYRQIYNKLGVEYFTGLTREEIAKKLHLPKPFTNGLCRWMQRSGDWKIHQRNLDGEKRREMRYSVV